MSGSRAAINTAEPADHQLASGRRRFCAADITLGSFGVAFAAAELGLVNGTRKLTRCRLMEHRRIRRDEARWLAERQNKPTP